MGHLFLDIETYPAEKYPPGVKKTPPSLNPYKAKAKVLLMAYNYYDSFEPPTKEQIREPLFIKEWELGEKALLKNFYDFVRDTQSKDEYMKYTGYNVARFDLPYLFGRMKVNEIASEEELYDVLLKPFATDLYQLSPIISEFTPRRKQLWGINHKEASNFFGLMEKEVTGVECTIFYDKGEYDKILEYSRKEFNLEQMAGAFYLHVLKMREAIEKTNA